MAKYKIIPSSRTIVHSPISIGHKAEKGVEAIEFDLTAWVETYGSGTLTVIMRRWGDAIPYPIALEIDENNKATWTLSDIDTAKAGMAYAQLNYIVGDEVVKKSDIYTFRVMDSLTGEGEPPEAYESWLEHLTHLAAEAMAEVLDIEGIVTDKTLTVDGGIADAKATGDALSALEDQFTEETDQLKADLDDYNSYDIIRRVGTFNNTTSSTVTYTWNEDKTQCAISGTATGGFSSNNLYNSNDVQMPPGMVAGKTYHVLFETTNSNIKLEILHYLNGATSGGVSTIIESTSDYTVPDNCTTLAIRLRVNDNTNGTGTVSKVAILNYPSNSDILTEINDLSGLDNLYVQSYTYNVQPSGLSSLAKRALSAPCEINGNGVIFVKNLPDTLHYSVCTYSSSSASSFINYTDNDWHEEETFIIDDSAAKYIRLYFGKKDSTALNDSVFDGSEIAVFAGVVDPVYYQEKTAKDTGARAIVADIRKTVKVCSWNVGLWNNGTTQYMDASNKYKWMRALGEIDADIIMTQESPYTVISDNAVTYPELLGYKYPYMQKPLSAESVYLSKGIVSVFPLANMKRVFFSDNQRTYIKTYVIINDIKICLINCHLTYETAVRAAEIAELITVMNDENHVICCGDFNAESVSDFDSFAEAGYKMANTGDFGQYVTWDHTTESWTNGVLDNCIVSSNIAITNVETISGTGSNGISDHTALVSTLIIN